MNRSYEVTVQSPDNKRLTFSFPSVTTILRAVIAKPQLNDWYYTTTVSGFLSLYRKYGDKLPSDERSIHSLLSTEGVSPYKLRDRASERGTKLHRVLERLAKGHRVARTAETEPLMRWWEKFQVHREPIAVEQPVVSFAGRYGGTVDLVTTDGMTTTLLDLKTSSNIYTEHVIQLEAYNQAWKEMYGYEIDEFIILHVPDEEGAEPEEYEFKPGVYRDAWLSCLALYDSLHFGRTRPLMKKKTTKKG